MIEEVLTVVAQHVEEEWRDSTCGALTEATHRVLEWQRATVGGEGNDLTIQNEIESG